MLPAYIEPQEIAAVKAKALIQVEIMLHMVQEFIQLGKCWTSEREPSKICPAI